MCPGKARMVEGRAAEFAWCNGAPGDGVGSSSRPCRRYCHSTCDLVTPLDLHDRQVQSAAPSG
jgi:hypothetical protein